MNRAILRGEQGAQNKVSYTEWSRDAKVYIKSKGKAGRLLVSAMEFAERLGDTPVTEDVLKKLGIDEDVVKQLENELYMLTNNFTAGHAKEVIQHGIHNGLDAWRKLCRHQFPLADDKRNILMTEFLKLKELASAGGLRHIIAEIERMTDHWEMVANRPFDEEAKIGKPRELVPSATWNYIAQEAGNARTYMELVTIVTNQLTDPKTGMLIGERAPALNDLGR